MTDRAAKNNDEQNPNNNNNNNSGGRRFRSLAEEMEGAAAAVAAGAAASSPASPPPHGRLGSSYASFFGALSNFATSGNATEAPPPPPPPAPPPPEGACGPDGRPLVLLRFLLSDGASDWLPCQVRPLSDGTTVFGVGREALAAKLGVASGKLTLDSGVTAAYGGSDSATGQAILPVQHLPYAMMVASPAWRRNNSMIAVCQGLLEDLEGKKGQDEALNAAHDSLQYGWLG